MRPRLSIVRDSSESLPQISAYCAPSSPPIASARSISRGSVLDLADEARIVEAGHQQVRRLRRYDAQADHVEATRGRRVDQFDRRGVDHRQVFEGEGAGHFGVRPFPRHARLCAGHPRP
jgi:hypothetical protein